MKATDARGNAIVCDDYVRVLDQGRRPQHPWVDDQREWAECTQTRSAAECRERLHE